jgi:RimJ/RimL family protein N-acetyltransferase
MWFVLLREPRTLVGTVGLKGPPVEGRADVGYAVLDAFQRVGYGTEATSALIDWAFADPRVACIVAETLPELAPSIRVIDKCGLVFVGVGVGHEGEPAVQQYQLTRERWAARQARR